MTFNTSDPGDMISPETAKGELSHDLRTPLAIIRMQAQLLIRLISRDGNSDGFDRQRTLNGLQRIDDAVTALTTTLDRIPSDDSDQVDSAPEVH